MPLLKEAESEEIARQAVDLLRSTVALGWNKPRNLASDPDLAPIRHRKDFQAILQGLQDRAFPADPFAK